MTQWRRVLTLAKRDLIAFFLCVILGTSAVLGLKTVADNLKSGVEAQQAALQEQQSQLVIKQDDLTNVRAHIKSYELLRQKGLVGEPDRAAWVEQLQSTYAALGLQGQIAVQLQAPVPLPAGDPTAATEGAPTAPLVHEMQFEMRESLETEVLGLIQKYREQVKGRFRVNSCKWFEPKDTGLTAQCVLRFVSIPAAQPAAQPAASSP
jgi:hypothetical protein